MKMRRRLNWPGSASKASSAEHIGVNPVDMKHQKLANLARLLQYLCFGLAWEVTASVQVSHMALLHHHGFL